MAEEIRQPVEALDPEEDSADKFHAASQWQLMWWRFIRHRLAVISLFVVLFLYFVAGFTEFLAPYDPNVYFANYTQMAPQPIRFVDHEGNFSLQPFVYGRTRERNMETLAWIYSDDYEQKFTLRFFVRTGEPYEMWGGLIETDLKFFGVTGEDNNVFLIGTDRLGRDVLSRILYGTRISMSIGLVGVTLSSVFGIFLGGISGYFGGWIDLFIQRIIEFLQSIPTIPLWMSLAAAMPLEWSPIRVYFMITVILSLIGWTGLARVVRGRFLSLREEDFVKAARLAGSGEMRIIFRHMLPSFLSHIIASLTLAIPAMILAETSLSFLGVGIRSPAVSWGTLLQEAQNLRTVANAPWLLTPAIPVVISILAFNFLGDGMRDAADPYSKV